MPRTARTSVGGLCFHVTGRGNRRETVFHEPDDYDAFLALVARADERIPMRILAYCLMPNHYHLVLRPHDDGDLGRFMHWLLTSHVQRHRRRHASIGRIWQGRFHASIIQADGHLLTVLRYVERNPLRAGLVERVDDWAWCSLPERLGRTPRRLVDASPVELPPDWRDRVEQPITAAELEAIRTCARRQRPYGDPAWTRGTAERLGLLSSLTARGRPRSPILATRDARGGPA
jgi:putative transposase